jgi:hypothetical protein
MVILYPRPYRNARLEIAWRPRPSKTWHAGYDLLPVAVWPWWKPYFHRGPISTHFSIPLGFGSLSVYWRHRP